MHMLPPVERAGKGGPPFRLPAPPSRPALNTLLMPPCLLRAPLRHAAFAPHPPSRLAASPRAMLHHGPRLVCFSLLPERTPQPDPESAAAAAAAAQPLATRTGFEARWPLAPPATALRTCPARPRARSTRDERPPAGELLRRPSAAAASPPRAARRHMLDCLRTNHSQACDLLRKLDHRGMACMLLSLPLGATCHMCNWIPPRSGVPHNTRAPRASGRPPLRFSGFRPSPFPRWHIRPSRTPAPAHPPVSQPPTEPSNPRDTFGCDPTNASIFL
jgi:hypothetical protein